MKIKTGRLYRSFEIETRGLDPGRREVALSFSSETPVERFFGYEILDHGPGAIKTERMERGLPILLDHDQKRQVGILEKPSIEPDRVGRGIGRFGKSALAMETFRDIQDGIKKYVSVGYNILEMRLESEEKGTKTYRATSWEPVEVSVVSIPADYSVGIGRNENSDFETEILEGEKTLMSDTNKVEILPGWMLTR